MFVSTVMPSLVAIRCARVSIAGTSPISSSAGGRSSTISERRFAISMPICWTASRTAAARRSGVLAAQRGGEQHLQAAEPLKGLVVQLAGPAAALLLGGLDAVAQAVLGDRRGGVHAHRGGRREGLEQPRVLGA